MYIAYKDYKGKLAKGDMVLMSAAEFAAGGNKLKGVPVAITPDGKEPVELPVEPVEPIQELTETELLQSEILLLKDRLAKIEATDTVKAELALKEAEPILSK